MSFFRSLFGTCCGPYVFSELRKNSWWRVFRHLLLLCLFCSVIIGVANYLLIKYRWRASYNSFNDIFGTELIFTEKGMFPEKSPNQGRWQEFPYNSLLIYENSQFPSGNYSDDMLQQRNLIVFWNQACVAVFSRENENSWLKVEIKPDLQREQSADTLTFKELKDDIARLSKLAPSENWVFPEEYKHGIGSYQLFRMARIVIVTSKALLFFIGGVFMTLFVTLFFSAVYRAFSAKGMQRFAFCELWKIAIYAAFPVILVVSAFPVLQLPLNGYCHYLFIIGWTIYLFYVLRYLNVNAENAEKTADGEADE